MINEKIYNALYESNVLEAICSFEKKNYNQMCVITTTDLFIKEENNYYLNGHAKTLELYLNKITNSNKFSFPNGIGNNKKTIKKRIKKLMLIWSILICYRLRKDIDAEKIENYSERIIKEYMHMCASWNMKTPIAYCDTLKMIYKEDLKKENKYLLKYQYDIEMYKYIDKTNTYMKSVTVAYNSTDGKYLCCVKKKNMFEKLNICKQNLNFHKCIVDICPNLYDNIIHIIVEYFIGNLKLIKDMFICANATLSQNMQKNNSANIIKSDSQEFFNIFKTQTLPIGDYICDNKSKCLYEYNDIHFLSYLKDDLKCITLNKECRLCKEIIYHEQSIVCETCNLSLILPHNEFIKLVKPIKICTNISKFECINKIANEIINFPWITRATNTEENLIAQEMWMYFRCELHNAVTIADLRNNNKLEYTKNKIYIKSFCNNCNKPLIENNGILKQCRLCQKKLIDKKIKETKEIYNKIDKKRTSIIMNLRMINCKLRKFCQPSFRFTDYCRYCRTRCKFKNFNIKLKIAITCGFNKLKDSVYMTFSTGYITLQTEKLPHFVTVNDMYVLFRYLANFDYHKR